jgi:hypothetical protein
MSVVFDSIIVNNNATGSGILTRKPVILASEVSYVLSGVNVGTLIDGVAIALDDRLLFKDQADPIENGLYDITNTGLIRSSDYTIGSDVQYTQVLVENGIQNESTTWLCQRGSRIVGTDPLDFKKINSLKSLKNVTRAVVDTLISTTRNTYSPVPDLDATILTVGSAIIFFSIKFTVDGSRSANIDITIAINTIPIAGTEQTFNIRRGDSIIAQGNWIEFEVNPGDMITLLWKTSRGTASADRRLLLTQEF